MCTTDLVCCSGVVGDNWHFGQTQILNERLTRGFGFNQHPVRTSRPVVGRFLGHSAILSLPVLDGLGAQIRVGQMLVPSVNEHGIAFTVVGEDCPDSAGSRVA